MRTSLMLVVVAGCVCATLGASLKEGEGAPRPLSDTAKAIQTSPELSRMVRKARSMMQGRSFFRSMGESLMNYLGYGDEEYVDEYGDSDYFYPNFESPGLLGGSGSSYSFYSPYGHNSPARDDNFEDEDEYGWGDFMFDAAVVAVPMALVLTAMPTGLFTIPIMGRSMSNDIDVSLQPYEKNVQKAVEKADFLSFTTRECQERIFCELSQVGKHDQASLLQKIMYLASIIAPESYAKAYGMDKLLKASREGQCEVFKCVPLMAPIFGKHKSKTN